MQLVRQVFGHKPKCWTHELVYLMMVQEENVQVITVHPEGSSPSSRC